METLIWTPKKRKVAELKELQGNPRKITEDAFAKLKERIQKRGVHDVVKLDADDTILSGNQRKRALTELGIKEVWALTPDRPLTEEERKAVVIESNRSDGQWDFDLLANTYDEQQLLDLGFSTRELDMVEFPELDTAELTEEVPNDTNYKYEVIFAVEHEIDDFTAAVNECHKTYGEATKSLSLLKHLRETMS